MAERTDAYQQDIQDHRARATEAASELLEELTARVGELEDLAAAERWLRGSAKTGRVHTGTGLRTNDSQGGTHSIPSCWLPSGSTWMSSRAEMEEMAT